MSRKRKRGRGRRRRRVTPWHSDPPGPLLRSCRDDPHPTSVDGRDPDRRRLPGMAVSGVPPPRPMPASWQPNPPGRPPDQSLPLHGRFVPPGNSRRPAERTARFRAAFRSRSVSSPHAPHRKTHVPWEPEEPDAAGHRGRRVGPGVTAGAPPSHRTCGFPAYGAPMPCRGQTIASTSSYDHQDPQRLSGFLSQWVATFHGRPCRSSFRLTSKGWTLHIAARCATPGSSLR